MDTNAESKAPITVKHNSDRDRYEAYVGDDFAGYAAYVDEGDVRDFNHTVTAPAFSGQGVAGQVVRYALDDTVGEGKKILPTCSYVQAFVRKHPDWNASLA